MAVTIWVTMMIMTIMMMAMNDHTLALFVDTYTLDTIRSVENDSDDDGDNDDGTDLSDTVGVNNLDFDKSVDDGSDDYYNHMVTMTLTCQTLFLGINSVDTNSSVDSDDAVKMVLVACQTVMSMVLITVTDQILFMDIDILGIDRSVNDDGEGDGYDENDGLSVTGLFIHRNVGMGLCR